MTYECPCGCHIEIADLRRRLATLRQRAFGLIHSVSCSHTTACTIWGDNGQGGTVEGFKEPLPCNCGALENFAKKQLAEAQQAREQTVNEFNAAFLKIQRSVRTYPPPAPFIDSMLNALIAERDAANALLRRAQDLLRGKAATPTDSVDLLAAITAHLEPDTQQKAEEWIHHRFSRAYPDELKDAEGQG